MCLQASPFSKNGQEQTARSVSPSTVSETSYSREPVTTAWAFSGPHSVRRTCPP